MMKKIQVTDTPKTILLRAILALLMATTLCFVGVCGIGYAGVLMLIELFKKVFNYDSDTRS